MKRRANGEGSIFKRPGGGWEGQASVKRADGTTKRVYVSGKTRAEVKAKLDAKSERVNQGLSETEKNRTVGEYLDFWLEDRTQKELIRITTIDSYSRCIKNHIKPTLGGYRLKALNAEDIDRALETLKQNKIGGAARQKVLRVLSACLGHAAAKRIIPYNPAQFAVKPRHRAKATRIWTSDQTALFLRETADHPLHIAFKLLLTYGMRRGEAPGLRWRDIDFESGEFFVRQQIYRVGGKLVVGELKTENSRRFLSLTPTFRAELLAYAKKHNITIPEFDMYAEPTMEGTIVVSEVGTPVEPRNLVRCFENLTKKLRLPRIKLHATRHTAATIMNDASVPLKNIQLSLGHASGATTLNIYQHGTPETRRSTAEAVEKYISARK